MDLCKSVLVSYLPGCCQATWGPKSSQNQNHATAIARRVRWWWCELFLYMFSRNMLLMLHIAIFRGLQTSLFLQKINRRNTIQRKVFQKHHNHHRLLRRQNHLKIIRIKKIPRRLHRRAPIKTSAPSQYRLVFV